jgi:hypothetical protein
MFVKIISSWGICFICSNTFESDCIVIASSAGISPEESGGRKKQNFFSKPIRRLKPIEGPAEEASIIAKCRR